MLMRISRLSGNPRAPREFAKRSPRNIALHTAHTMRVPETPPLVLRAGFSFWRMTRGLASLEPKAAAVVLGVKVRQETASVSLCPTHAPSF
jgi:hypothetical protein